MASRLDEGPGRDRTGRRPAQEQTKQEQTKQEQTNIGPPRERAAADAPRRRQVPPQPERDWAAEKVDLIVDAVERIKSLTTDRAIIAARSVVFGLVIVLLAVAALILLVAICVRLADAYLPIGSGVGDATWAAHAFVGGSFTALGTGAWASRRGEGPPKPLYVAAGIVGLVLLVLIIFGIAGLVY